MKTILNLLICVSLNSLFISSIYSQDEQPSIELEQQLRKTADMDSTRIKILIQLANKYMFSNPEKTVAYAEEAVSIARQVSPNKLLKALVSASGIMIKLGRFQQAASLLKEVILLKPDYNDFTSTITAFSNLGILYDYLGDEEKAEYYFTKAYDMAVKENIEPLIMSTVLNIGVLCGKMHHDDQAIIYFNKAIEISKRHKDWNPCAISYANLGTIYGDRKEIDKANRLFDSCQYIIDTYHLPISRSIELATSRAAINSPNANIKLFDDFLNVPNLSITDPDLIEVYHILADAYFKTKQWAAALKHAQAGISLQKELEAIDVTYIDNCQIIANIHMANKNWAEASKWQQEIITTKDTLDIQNHRRTVTLALVSHEIESKEKELQEKNNQLRIRQRIYEISAIAAGIILLVLGLTLYYRIRLRRSLEEAKLKAQYTQQLEEEVKARVKELEQVHTQIQEAKERENISLALLNQRHAELLEHITQKLKAWQEQALITDTQATRPLLNDIRTAQSQAEEWGSFMLHFERMHPEFTDKLKQHASDLKLSDLKHCAYMRLGMTRKQVAETLHCSEEAVKQARNKVRKKLGLAPEASLQDFINQF